VQAAFYMGYLVGQLPGGYFVSVCGAKRVIAAGLFVSITMSLITPFVAASFPAVMAVRIVMGLGEGTVYPSVASLCSKWIPYEERNLGVSLVQTGGQIGIVIALYVTFQFTAWQHSFYAFSGVGYMWCAVWLWYGSDEPSSHRYISRREAAMIDASIRRHQATTADVPVTLQNVRDCPREPAVWALNVAAPPRLAVHTDRWALAQPSWGYRNQTRKYAAARPRD
jgi:MFS family permease